MFRIFLTEVKRGSETLGQKQDIVLGLKVRLGFGTGETFQASGPFSSPEAAILLVSAGDRDLWPLPISEHAQSTRSVFFSQSDLSYLTMSP